MSGSTSARIAARYSASARGVSEADLQHVNMLLHQSTEVFPKSTGTTSPPLTTFTKMKILPGNIGICANARTSTSFLRSSGAREEVAAVVPVDGDVHHLRGGEDCT